MRKFLWLVILISFLFAKVELNATHIIGGDLQYKCLGNDSYEVTLVIYRDCYNGIPYFDAVASISFFDSSDVYQFQTLVPFQGVDDTLSPGLDACLIIPPDICVHRTQYRDTVNLPFLPGGYQMIYQRCCRNNDILNMVNSQATGATYVTYIAEEALVQCNTSAVFTEWPPPLICVNKPIEFDHSAFDPDGDSLVYELCAPFTGAVASSPQPQPAYLPISQEIPWQFPYWVTNMIGMPDPLVIDPQTGLLTGTPYVVGRFVVCVSVKEYRNGILLSTNRRDFQYNVAPCQEEISALFIAPSLNCVDDLTVEFQNFSTSAGPIPGFFWDFGEGGMDEDTSSLTEPSYVYSDTGTYLVTMIAGPGAVCSDTFYQEVSIFPNSVVPDFEYTLDNCSDSITVFFEDVSEDNYGEIVGWEWYIGGGTISNDSTASASFSTPGGNTVKLIITSSTGCKSTLQENFNFDFLNIDLKDSLTCIGVPIRLNPQAEGNATYFWEPPLFLNDSDTSSPVFSGEATMDYEVTVLTSSGDTCRDHFPVSVFVPEEIAVSIPVDTFSCEGFISLLAEANVPTEIEWAENIMFSPSLSDNELLEIEINQDQYFYTKLVDEYGCIKVDSVYVFDHEVDLALDPSALVCGGDTIYLLANSLNPEDELMYFWTPDSNLISGQNTEEIVVAPLADQWFFVDAENQHGCVSIDSILLEVNFEQPILEIENSIDSIYPGESIQLVGTFDPNYQYEWTPNIYLDDPLVHNPTATPGEEVVYYLTVTNEFGCTNTASAQVRVRSFSCESPYIFLPSGFTPNADGMNDVLLVRGNAVESLEFAVYDRWGKQVFYTKNQDEGWDGMNEVGELMPAAVYGYYLEVKCLQGETYFKKGNVTLIR